MPIDYRINQPYTVDQFIDLLNRSTLGERRPVHNRQCLEGMVKNSNLAVTAWDGGRLIGLARSITDFHYACYLSDLAVDSTYQRQGIGKELQRLTQTQLGSECQLILIAAPTAHSYYEHLGYQHNQRCWVLDRNSEIR